jgi:hypothetical protein
VKRDPVDSSYCTAIGHDPDANELHVEWPSGKVSIYSDVSAEQHKAVVGAVSVGRAVIQIKNTKAHRYG